MKKHVERPKNLKGAVDHQAHLTSENIVNNPWRALRRYTDARIGLGRAGVSLPTSEMLDFQLSHARARDAVKLPLNIEKLQQQLAEFAPALPCQPMALHSQAFDRTTFLQRPDLGRKLNDISRNVLLKFTTQQEGDRQLQYDLAIVVADGLSSIAVQRNVRPLLDQLIPLLKKQSQPCSLAPLTIVEQGRVAIGDEVGQYLNAKAVLMLIGERPGLSAPDSLGVYFTWEPKIGLNDARRNCISNIRPAGLGFDVAAQRVLYLLKEARRLKTSGVQLKDRSHDRRLEAFEHKRGRTHSFLAKPS
tara:strand:+ start:5332 stop:6240 length:909 start_codon:yes stop_codon:yes gene_type:complete